MKKKKQYKRRFVEDIFINNQQTRSISVQGGEGKPFKDCLGTHKTKLTSPADNRTLSKEEIEFNLGSVYEEGFQKAKELEQEKVRRLKEKVILIIKKEEYCDGCYGYKEDEECDTCKPHFDKIRKAFDKIFGSELAGVNHSQQGSLNKVEMYESAGQHLFSPTADTRKGCGKKLNRFQKCGDNIATKYKKNKGILDVIYCDECSKELAGVKGK